MAAKQSEDNGGANEEELKDEDAGDRGGCSERNQLLYKTLCIATN